MSLNAEQENIANDLLAKVTEDVHSVLSRNMSLVPPNLVLAIGERGVVEAAKGAALALDAANGTPFEHAPTRESMVMIALVTLHIFLDADDPWTAAAADLKKYFPDAKMPEVEVVDRRADKQKAA